MQQHHILHSLPYHLLTLLWIQFDFGSFKHNLSARDTGIIHHGPSDVHIKSAALIAVVLKLQYHVKVVSHANVQIGDLHLHVALRKRGFLSLTAKLLSLLQHTPLLWAPWDSK